MLSLSHRFWMLEDIRFIEQVKVFEVGAFDGLIKVSIGTISFRLERMMHDAILIQDAECEPKVYKVGSSKGFFSRLYIYADPMNVPSLFNAWLIKLYKLIT